MKIAIVGTGISGLLAAHVLCRRHEVVVFEARERLGGHTHTVDVETPNARYAIDTGFIVFNEPHYPGFTRLLRRLGVPTQPTEMSFSVRCDEKDLEYNGTSLGKLFSQRRNFVRPSFWRMIRDILRFAREAPRDLGTLEDDTSVTEYAGAHGYGAEFLDDYLVPLGSALWSTPPALFRKFPARFVLEFLHNHAMLQVSGRPTWRVVRGGSSRYIPLLTAPFRDGVRLACPVRKVLRHGDRVEIRHDGGPPEFFDEVVIACHADQALEILGDASTAEHEVLAEFPYQLNEVVLHTDTSLLPRCRRAWASWNYRVQRGAEDRATVTYNMNLLQSLKGEDVFCVTLNDATAVRPDRILRKLKYSHPMYTAGRRVAQSRHHELIRSRFTSFCGAYWGYGFHEDGVSSALRVCEAFGMSLES